MSPVPKAIWPNRRKHYSWTLQLPCREPASSQKAALDRAHELRKFEIENYWRRATYFWGFQLVAFGAVAFTAYRGAVFPPLILIVAVLGAVTSWSAILTARGSKFWQENWEAHVDFLEDEVEGRLHKIALVHTTLQPSVSHVNERLLQALCFGWLAGFAVASATLMFPELLHLSKTLAAACQVVGCSVALILGLAWVDNSRRSSLPGRAFWHKSMKPYDGL